MHSPTCFNAGALIEISYVQHHGGEEAPWLLADLDPVHGRGFHRRLAQLHLWAADGCGQLLIGEAVDAKIGEDPPFGLSAEDQLVEPFHQKGAWICGSDVHRLEGTHVVWRSEE